MTDQPPSADPSPSPIGPGLRMAIDIGPILVFFVVYKLTPGTWSSIRQMLWATAAFMAANVVAMLVSWWKARKISPMLWMTGVLVLVFGGLTLWFHDDTFIKVKPTIVYAMFAAILGFGLATGRPLLKMLLEAAYPGLTETGWRKLTVNWTGFFLFMALLNEIVWRSTDFEFWLGFKLWGAIPLTLIFAIANVPMLMKHGMGEEMKKSPPVPPEQ